jgi:hypothetical protein
MRMEELSESRYVKTPDSVERYLLSVVAAYFREHDKDSGDELSSEYIIDKAVERMKEEINIDSVGVLSITLPDGEPKTGAVTITLEDLNGEPLIETKYSAFNVNFGTEENTACEGNDPRLSDARIPLPHSHEISDVIGLEGILSTIIGKIERTNGFLHTHNNKNVLDILVYTGNNSYIDLTVLDTLEDKIIRIVNEIRNEILDYRQEVINKVAEVQTKIDELQAIIDSLRQHVIATNQQYFQLSKNYSDEKINQAQNEIEALLVSLAKKSELSNVLEIANNVFTLAGSMRFRLDTVIDFASPDKQSVSVNIDAAVLNELMARGQNLHDCQIEYIIEYDNPNTLKIMNGTFPYILIHDNLVDGSIQIGSIEDNKLLVTYSSDSTVVPDEIMEASAVINFYSKKMITL